MLETIALITYLFSLLALAMMYSRLKKTNNHIKKLSFYPFVILPDGRAVDLTGVTHISTIDYISHTSDSKRYTAIGFLLYRKTPNGNESFSITYYEESKPIIIKPGNIVLEKDDIKYVYEKIINIYNLPTIGFNYNDY